MPAYDDPEVISFQSCWKYQLRTDHFKFADKSYVAYVHGMCDVEEEDTPTGFAFVILKDELPISIASSAAFGGSELRAELTAISNACYRVPRGSYLDIYSENKYAISSCLSGYSKWNKAYLDFYKSCSCQLIGIRFHISSLDDMYADLARELAYDAYSDLCHKYDLLPFER